MDEENVMSAGRHAVEFKHIFERFNTPVNNNDNKRKDDDHEDGEDGSGKDAITKATE
jgi:hypothetical protein